MSDEGCITLLLMLSTVLRYFRQLVTHTDGFRYSPVTNDAAFSTPRLGDQRTCKVLMGGYRLLSLPELPPTYHCVIAGRQA